MKVERKIINYQYLLDQFGETLIFQHVLGFTPQLHKKYRSPEFLRDDKNAGCYFVERRGRLYFYDHHFGSKGFSCFDLAMKKYNCSFNEVIKILHHELQSKKKLPQLEAFSNQLKIKIITEDWNTTTLEYWTDHGVNEKLLIDHNVYYVAEAWMNSRYYLNQFFHKELIGPTFAYVFESGNIKLYSPNEKYYKHYTNTNITDVFGIFEDTKRLIVTSSPKDVLVLKSILPDISIVCTNSENVLLPYDKLEHILDKYKVTLFYDNDDTGIKYSKLHSEYYNCNFVLIPDKFKVKDISDFFIQNKQKAIEFAKTI